MAIPNKLLAIVSFICLTFTPAHAGCLRGAMAGAAVGHVLGHHGVAGAAIGCIAAHHKQKSEQKKNPQEKPARKTRKRE